MAVSVAELDGKCKKTLEHFKKELGHVRTGRANSSILDGIHVDYYGTSVPLIQLAMVNAPEPRLLTVQVYDANAVESVEKAIQKSNLGLSPNRDGSLIRLVIATLTEERRKEFIKGLHKMAEDSRIVMRNNRREMIDELKKKVKAKQVSEDEERRAGAEVQKITDRYIKDIDQLVGAKEKEMMEV